MLLIEMVVVVRLHINPNLGWQCERAETTAATATLMLNNFKDIFRSLRYVDGIHLINSHSPYKSNTVSRRYSDNVLVSYHKAVSTRWSLVLHLLKPPKKTPIQCKVTK